MGNDMKTAKLQGGVMLIEALVGLLIFSFGVLGLIGMQAVASKVAGDAKYRGEAAAHAEQLINQMWADDRGTLEASYQPGQPKYDDWVNQVKAAGTGLPGASISGNEPVATLSADKRFWTITVRWQGPEEKAAHRYTTIAWIN